ncbi:MAG TPA: ATP-binding protein [Gemmatimonadales bacterium]|nr:ATP-binding protein [Gemmatimonadales bacterium]
MLLARSHRNQESRIALEDVPHVIGRETFQWKGLATRHRLIAGMLAAIGCAQWLRAGGAGWAYGTIGVTTLMLVWTLGRRARRWADPALAGAAVLVIGALLRTVNGTAKLECCWSTAREERLDRASQQLSQALGAAVSDARDLARRAAGAAASPRDEAFDGLATAMKHGTAGVERGVALVAADGTPIAWAGRHRFLPVPDTAELRASISPFYVTLEARRQTGAGAAAVGTVLLDAGPAVPDGDGAVARRFAREYGVDLKFYAPRTAPHDPDVFDFCARSCDLGDTLFSVKPLPPVQAEALEILHRQGQRGVAIGVLLLLLFLLMEAPVGPWRWAALAVAAGTLARFPVVPVLTESGPSPPTLAQPLLGFISGSAVALGVVSAAVLVAAAALWRRGLPRRWYTLLPAGFLLLAAPYLVRYFGRGIRPPSSGVSIPLWLSWQVALAAVAMALVMLAAALVRGPEEPRRVPWTLAAACLWAIAAAVAGLWLWQPYNAWPEWYTFLWIPALAGSIVPARRRAALFAVATVAGTAAALVTWGASVEGRLSLAQRDVAGLGAVRDPAIPRALDSLATVTDTIHPPQSAGALYALWHSTSLATQGYPAVLALWTQNGQLETELRLAALDLPDQLLAALVHRPGAPAIPRVEELSRIPGVHEVLVAPLMSGEWITIGVGPRTLLAESDRVTRFLRGEGRVAAPYTLTISAPSPTSGATERFTWNSREGWVVRGEQRFDFPDGVRHVHAVVALGGAGGLLVRGSLVVLIDLALLVALMAAGGLFVPWPPREGPSPLARLRRSYRLRLAAVLVTFFVTPVLAFGAWSFADLTQSAAFAGDLLITQTLRDATRSAEQVPFGRPDAPQAIQDLGTRLDAGLWAYRGGALVGTSEPVLADLGLVDPLMAPGVFQRVALRDEIEATATGQAAGRTVRVGYRVVVNGGTTGQVVLAAPQLLDDSRVRMEEREFALDLALATIAGLAAAAGLAGLAARRLERPVAVLREAAVAVGRGGTPPAFPEAPPVEFAPVMSAFARMVVDVKRSQEALEEARGRTAQVLATVATGVIAVDAALRVTLLNPRAVELLGTPVAPGDELPAATGPEWGAVWEDVSHFMAASRDQIAEREVDVGMRRVRVQIALLGPAPDGCVIALDDTTALSRAARVLAWGQMARQVAHEIKNPLTPVRLGIQHLLRVWQSEPKQFDRALADTAKRILSEIDRLDAIARGFARFGAPGAEAIGLESVNLLAVARDVVSLYELGEQAGAVTVEGRDNGEPVQARRDEIREVLLNLLENARDAGATRIQVLIEEGGRRLSVRDNGRGIPEDLLPRVFEPTFSTTSSGSGLGLAIAKRLVEGWGATIGVESRPGVGTTLTVTFPRGGE